MPDYAWKCLNNPEYGGIYTNMSKSAWMPFVLHVPIVIPGLLECIVTYFNNVYSLKAVFLKGKYLICSVVAGSIWLAFCFRLNTVASKISHLLLPLEPRGPRASNLDMLLQSIKRINVFRETCILYALFLISLLGKGL